MADEDILTDGAGDGEETPEPGDFLAYIAAHSEHDDGESDNGEVQGEEEEVTDPEGEEQPEGDDEPALPDKFKGKSAAEIAKSYEELERELGRLRNEVGNKRKATEEAPEEQPADEQPEAESYDLPTLYADEELRSRAQPAAVAYVKLETSKLQRQLARDGYSAEEIEERLADERQELVNEAWHRALIETKPVLDTERRTEQRFGTPVAEKNIESLAESLIAETKNTLGIDEVEAADVLDVLRADMQAVNMDAVRFGKLPIEQQQRVMFDAYVKAAGLKAIQAKKAPQKAAQSAEQPEEKPDPQPTPRVLRQSTVRGGASVGDDGKAKAIADFFGLNDKHATNLTKRITAK